MPYVLAIFALLILTAGALNTIPVLAVPSVLLIGWLIKVMPKDAIENFFAWCFGAGILLGIITVVQQFF